MKAYRQDPPFAVQVELVEGCNLMCGFCGINGIRGKAGGYKYMTGLVAAATADGIAKAGWNSRIEFAMHGEPSIHPDMDKIMGIFRDRLPNAQLMMTTNGTGFLKNTAQTIQRMFDYGLNILAVDAYEHCDYSQRLRTTMELGEDALPWSVKEYPADPKASPHSRHPKNTRMVVFIQDITKATKGGHSVLNNHCGAAAPAVDFHARCAKPFRELSIRWDGNVSCCCNDWRGLYKIGNVVDQSIESLWDSPRMVALRKMLYSGRRDHGACKGCNAVSYRTGLLPDKFGKQTMEPLTNDDLRIIKEATSGKPFTPVVIRPWEGK